MSTTMKIPAHEAGVIRLFFIDLDDPQINAFSTPKYVGEDTLDWPLKAALGATNLDEDFVEVFPVSNLDGLGLAGYLVEGNDVPEDQIEAMRGQLEAIEGHVCLIFSSAFGDFAQTLTPKAPLRHIATFFTERLAVRFAPLPDESAQTYTGPPAKKKPSDAAMGGRVATIALLFLFIFTAVFIWIAAA